MDLPTWSKAERVTLSKRGLEFERFTAPDNALTFLFPKGWRVDWREDHAVVRHGVPPKGHLTVFPLPGDAPKGEALLTAFLDEFLAPAAKGLNLTHLGAIPGDAPLHGARFSLVLGGNTHQGVALATRDRGLSLVAAYWVEEAMFNKELVTSLLKVVLGSIDTLPDSSLRPPLPQGLVTIDADDLWLESLPEEVVAEGFKDGCFALRLPPNWRCDQVEGEDGHTGWILSPPGVTETQPSDVLIAVTSEDLYGSLEDTMFEALTSMDPNRLLRLELPIMTVEKEGHRAMIQLFVSHPDSEGFIQPVSQRLWSAAWTDEATVVHVVAIGEARRIHELLADLTAIAAGLKVLPRPIDLEGMDSLAGDWRYQTFPTPGEMSLVAEHRYDLSADGRFTLSVEEKFLVEPNPDEVALAQQLAEGGPDALAVGAGRDRLAADSESDTESAAKPADVVQVVGEWDLVGSRLTFRYDEGGVELRQLESQHGSMAIVDGTIWQRSGPASNAHSSTDGDTLEP